MTASTETTETVLDALESIDADADTLAMRELLTGAVKPATLSYEQWTKPMKLTGGRVCLRIGEKPETAIWWFMWLPEGMHADCRTAKREIGPRAVKTLKQGLAMRLPVKPVLKENTPFGSDGGE